MRAYREPANALPPPPIFGFAFYVMGTGCLALAVAQLGAFAESAHVLRLAPLPSWASVIGQAMMLIGLAIASRAAKGHQRRLLGVSAVLWLTLLVIELQRGPVVASLAADAPRGLFASTTATLVGHAIVLLVLALVVHTSGRAFASRTWATTLGATLVFADAWAGAWPILTRGNLGEPSARLLLPTPSMASGGVGLLLVSGGLYAAGRAILGGITIDEYLRAHPKPTSEDDDAELPKVTDVWTARLRAGTPLFADAAVTAAGLALSHAAALVTATSLRFAVHDVSDTTTLGGELLVSAMMIVALRRMKPFTARPLTAALLGACAVMMVGVLRCLAWTTGVFAASGASSTIVPMLPPLELAPPLLMAGALYGVGTALGREMPQASPFARLRAQVRLAAVTVGASGLLSWVAVHVVAAPSRQAVLIAAVVLAAWSLAMAVRVAGQARRIEIALNR